MPVILDEAGGAILDEAGSFILDEAGLASFTWGTGSPFLQWKITGVISARWRDAGFQGTDISVGIISVEWNVGYQSIGLSVLATEYVLIPVAVTKSGLPYNPTGDPVVFAFMPTPTQVPQVSDWVSGSWDTDTTNILYPYSAKCLVGPSGTITLGIGTYVIYVKITDNPEIPVLIAGQLQVS